MKIRTDFVTNSSSSSFTVAICFKMKDGKEITHSAEWADEETDMIVKKSPLEFAKAKDMDELIKMLDDSIYIDFPHFDDEIDEEDEDIIDAAEEYEERSNTQKKFGKTLKRELKKYEINDIDSITLKTFETDDIYSYNSYKYNELPPKNYGNVDFDDENYHQTHYQVYKYDFQKKEATYFDDGGWVETNGGIGGSINFKIDKAYKKTDLSSFEENKKNTSKNKVVKKSTNNKNRKLKIQKGVLISGKGINVIIPDFVISIGSGAFSDCESLKEVIISDSVKDIRGFAFSGCDNLETVKISDSVITIGRGAFFNDENLNTINIPDSVTSIGEEAFNGCKSLETVIIPDSVKEIGYYAFTQCENLKTVKISNSIELLEDGVFSGCESLKEVIIPDSVTSIGSYAFYRCSSLETLIIPDSVTEIGEVAFQMCDSLTEVHLPEHLKEYKETAFDKGVMFL